jgi:hypothetical protein
MGKQSFIVEGIIRSRVMDEEDKQPKNRPSGTEPVRQGHGIQRDPRRDAAWLQRARAHRPLKSSALTSPRAELFRFACVESCKAVLVKGRV